MYGGTSASYAWYPPPPRRHPWRTALLITLAVVVAVVLSCGGLVAQVAVQLFYVPPVINQGHDLPALHYVDLGYNYVEDPVWSPDGRWIAAFAGGGPGETHFVVFSPDGKFRHDLSSWNCGQFDATDDTYSIAWLSDGSLSCVNGSDTPVICIGYPPFATCRLIDVDHAYSSVQGAAWSPHGDFLLAAAETMVGNQSSDATALQVVGDDGRLRQVFQDDSADYSSPVFVPEDPTSISYIITPHSPLPGGIEPSTLAISTLTPGARAGQLVLGPPTPIVTDPGELGINWDDQYAWSPSGQWIAVRHGDYRSGDKIYLVNPSNPAQKVDIVLADLTHVQFDQPIWSPDGSKLMVFTVEYARDHAYVINIGQYLKSRGLPV